MDRTSVAAAASRFGIRLPDRAGRSRSGERMGRGTGSSLEFQDFRQYAPGDDVRHVDWAAYARRDELVVRLYREEITPLVEVVLDGSASMGSTEAKRERTRELALALCGMAAADRLAARLWEIRGESLRHDRDLDRRLEAWDPGGPAGLEGAAERPPGFRRRSLRVVLSDLLFPAAPRGVVRALARDAARLVVVQILDAEELDPRFEGGVRLIDVESGSELDLVAGAAARRRYLRRLHALQAGWRAELRRVGGALAIADASLDLGGLLSGPLLAAELVEVRGAHSGARR